MANPHQQYPYNTRPPSASYPNAGGMMNMNPAAMNLNMGGMPGGMNMGGMQNMGGMGTMQGSAPGQMSSMGAPNPMQQHQLLNQYQLQMRAHAGNGIAQQQQQQQQQIQNQQMNPQQHQAPQPFGGAAPGMGMQHQQMPGSGMSIAMPPNQYSMGGMNQPMNMKQSSGMPLSYPQQTYQQTPQQPQYPSQSQPYPGNGGTGMPMGYPQRPPTAQGGHVGPPSTPTMQQHQPNPTLYSQGGMGMGMNSGGAGMPGMNSMGYQQNGMSGGPGRPPSAMGGMQQQSMAGMPPSNKPPQTPSMGGMNPPPPMHTPMMSSQPLGNQGMGMGPPSNMMGNPSGMQPQNPMQMTPQQMMQFQQMQRQQHQQGMMMNDMQQQQPQHTGPPSMQIPASPATTNAMTQPPLSSTSAPGRTPTPTLPPQSSSGMRSATPTSAQAPQQPPMHAPSPIHGAGGPGTQPMSARPPSAAGSISSGIMAPPGGAPNKIGYPMNAPGGGMGMGGVNTSHMDPSVLQMLGNQAGAGPVSNVGPGMFSNPIVPPAHTAPGPGMHPGPLQTNGPMGPAPSMHGQPPAPPNQGVYNSAMGSNGLRQVGPAPIPSLQMHSRGSLPSNLSIGSMGPSTLPGQIPLTMGGPTSSAPNAMIANNIGNSLTLSNRSGRAPSHPPAPQPQQQPQQALSLAERTMSPRQRAAVIPTITRITSVPADDKDHPLSELLPVLGSEEIENVRNWIGKDRKYEGEYRKMKEAMGKELAEAFGPIPAQPGNASGAVGKVLRWFEKDWREDAGRRDPRHPSGKLMWPQQKRVEKERRFRLLGRKPVFLPRPIRPEAANLSELLVPIRLDVDVGDGYNRFRDTFVWNANDPYVTPAVFAQSLCDDFSIGFGLGSASDSARSKFIQQVIASMQEQTADFKNHQVEIEAAQRKNVPIPPTSKPISTVGGLKVNGRERSISRSPTPLPGQREKSEKPLSVVGVQKKLSFNTLDSALGQKRARPAHDGPEGVDKIDDDEEWWERWRKRMRVMDGSGQRRTRKTSGGSPKKRSRNPASAPLNGVPSVGIKVEVNEADIKDSLVKIEEPDEYQRELLFVDEDDDLEAPTGVNEDLRILIKLDISFGIQRLEDQFEWDISDKRNSPEHFAERYCIDLGLSGEFKTAIAHSIREQVQVYEKSLFLVGHPMDGTTILDEDLRLAFLPSLNSSIRPLDQVRIYTPQLNLFNESELEKTFDRGGPRKRRQPRGRRAGAVPLPDRDPIKTFRTPMIGFPEVEKEKDTWVAPSRRQAAMNAERANAQIAVIESEADIRQQPPYMGTMQPNSSQTPQASRQMSVPVSGAPQAKPIPEGPQKKTRAELLQGPPVAKRVRRSRLAPKSTALDPGAPIPEYLRGYDERNKGGEKKKNMYRERELPEGLHPNMVDGVWHCSSCGCPEDLAIGRRQGPLGPKTMCGECGKWWHRHRKPMDLVYRTDREYHVERTKKEEEYRKLKKKGGAKAAAVAAAAIVDGRAAALKQERQLLASSGPQPLFTTVPRPLSHSSRSHPPPKPLVVQSPESSLSPPPFTPQTLKPPTETRLEVPAMNAAKPEAITPPPSSAMTNGVEGPPVRPEWLVSELARLRAKYPESIFDVLPKPRPATAPPGTPVEWRVRCNDCPGKLYNPGGGDTLNNFEIHLKNRQHRAKVAERRGLAVPSPPTSAVSTNLQPTQSTPTPTPSSQMTPSFVAAPAPSPSVINSASLSAGNPSLSPKSITNLSISSPQPQPEPVVTSPVVEKTVAEPERVEMDHQPTLDLGQLEDFSVPIESTAPAVIVEPPPGEELP